MMDFKDLQNEFDERIRSISIRFSNSESEQSQILQKLEKKIVELEKKVLENNNLSHFCNKKQIDLNYKIIEKDKVFEDFIHKFEDLRSKLFGLEDNFIKTNNQNFQSIAELKQQSFEFKKIYDFLSSKIELAEKEIEILKKQHDFDSGSIKNHSHEIENLKDKLSNCKTQLDNLVIDYFSTTKPKCQDLVNSFLKFCENNAKEIDNLNKSIAIKNREFLEQAYKKISEISIPDVSNFAEKEDLHKLRHEIAIAGIDAKNAGLKTSNLENQLHLTSKRVENIFLKLSQTEKQ